VQHRRELSPGLNRSLLALGLWTVFIWTSRVRNILADDALAGWSLTWRLGAAIGFMAAGILVLVGRFGRLSWAGTLAGVLGAVGALWWLVRGIGTLFGDFGVGFIVVHTVLAVVSITLGYLVVRELGWLRSLAAGRADRYDRSRYG
jgi:hypothetical protein